MEDRRHRFSVAELFAFIKTLTEKFGRKCYNLESTFDFINICCNFMNNKHTNAVPIVFFLLIIINVIHSFYLTKNNLKNIVL